MTVVFSLMDEEIHCLEQRDRETDLRNLGLLILTYLVGCLPPRRRIKYSGRRPLVARMNEQVALEKFRHLERLEDTAGKSLLCVV